VLLFIVNLILPKLKHNSLKFVLILGVRLAIIANMFSANLCYVITL